MAAVVFYATQTCPFCIAAERLLRERGVIDMDKRLLDLQPELREEMLERSGGRYTVPQIFINSQHIGGYDDLYLFDQHGGLERALGEANV